MSFKKGTIIQTYCVGLALAESTEFKNFVRVSFMRYSQKDWGELSEDDKGLNDLSLQDGSRIFASYKLPKTLTNNSFGDYGRQEEKMWIITDAANEQGVRACTTLLFPSEY